MVETTLFDKEPLRWSDDVRIEGIGIYAIFLPDISVAPDDWQADLRNENNLLYIGQSKKGGLKSRLKTHFAGTSSSMSAFRRAIGAMLYENLELEPYYSSDKAKQYRFRKEEELSHWIQKYCTYAFCIIKSDVKEAEKEFIKEHKPPLNTKHNLWGVHPLLVNGARIECMKLAKSNLNMR